jgi:hypothetical protein
MIVIGSCFPEIGSCIPEEWFVWPVLLPLIFIFKKSWLVSSTFHALLAAVHDSST